MVNMVFFNKKNNTKLGGPPSHPRIEDDYTSYTQRALGVSGTWIAMSYTEIPLSQETGDEDLENDKKKRKNNSLRIHV